MSWFTNLITHVEVAFTSPKAKAALEMVAALAPIAQVVVAEIEVITPNKTLSEVSAAYDKFGVPFLSTAVSSDPNAVGNALLNLGTSVLQTKLPADKANAAQHILQTAVQLAVVATKAG